MTKEAQRFPAKIILFGEQTVLHGSGALAIPFSNFFGVWSFGSTQNEEMQSLSKLLSKTNFTWFDYDQFKGDLNKNIFFKSTIPYSSGLGSSGALSAALYKRFALVHDEEQLRERLAALESMFHGKSSGIDPYISFTSQGLKINKDGITPLPDVHSMFRHVYILHSGIPRSALKYIQLFAHKMQDDQFNEICFNKCIVPVNEIIEKSTSKTDKNQSYMSEIKKISQFQFDHLPEFITDNIRPIWKSGLDTDRYYMKLCGAGGGGFYLLFANQAVNPKDIHGLEIFQVFE